MPQIIFIGPSGTGKSTLGKLLAQRLRIPRVSLDELRWAYYAEIGYDESLARHLRQTQGFLALIHYWKPFNVHAVERVLDDHSYPCVIDFGAAHSMYEDEAELKRVQEILLPCRTVVLILPSPDLDESVQILTERQQSMAPPADLGIIGGIVEHQVKHHSNHHLGKLVIYTKDKTPEETCDELIGRLNL